MISASARTVVANRALPYFCKYLGVNAAFRAAQQNRLLILGYHSVVSDEHYNPVHSDYALSVSSFREQMEILARCFNPISVSDLADWWVGRTALPKHPVLITFDDGYRNNLTNAAPVLRRLGIPAVFHISTGYIGQQRILWILEIYWRALHWSRPTLPMPALQGEQPISTTQQRLAVAARLRQTCKKLPYDECQRYLNRLRELEGFCEDDSDRETFGFLSWDEVRDLKNQGFEIGSHTVEHPILTRIPASAVDQELRASKLIIEEQTGALCRCFAYPSGGPADVSHAVIRSLETAGYKFAFTTTTGFCSRNQNAYELGRTCIPGNVSAAAFQNRVSGLHSLLKRLVAR